MQLSRRTFTTAAAALAASALLPISASAQSLADLKKKGKITIGMLVDFPPYGILNTSNFFFEEDGRFSNQRLTATDHPRTAAQSRRGSAGRYRLSGYTLHLQVEGGEERRLFFCAMDKGRKALQIGSSVYVRQ